MIGQLLGIDQSTVSRAMRELHGLAIVEREGTGPVTKWRLLSDWGWSGNVEAYHAHRRT